MKQINKILVVFFIVTSLTVFGAWRFIHSHKFSEQASKKVSEILTKKFGAKLSFVAIDFSIFPPATIFKQVHIEKRDPLLADLDILVDELAVSFTYTSFFSSNLEIDDVTLKNGSISIVQNKHDDSNIEWKKIDLKKIYENYLEIYQQSPVHLNIGRLEKIKLKIDQNTVSVDNFSLAPHKKDIRLKLLAREIHVEDDQIKLPKLDLNAVEANITFNKEQWKIEKLRIEQGLNFVDLKSAIFNKFSKVDLDANVNFNVNIEHVLSFIPKLPKEFSLVKGNAEGVIKFRNEIFDPDFDLEISLKNFKSDWINVDYVSGAAKKRKNLLIVEKMKASNGTVEKYELEKPITMFDFKKMDLVRTNISISMENAFTNTFLYSLKDSLGLLKGYLTGRIDFVWNKDRVLFNVKDRAYFKNFKLKSNSSKTPILQNAGFTLESTSISVDEKNRVGINAKLQLPNSTINVNGEITNKDINISLLNSKIDLHSFGPISGLAINGSGPASVEIHGPVDDVQFEFDVDWSNFKVADLNLGKVKSQFSLGLKTLILKIDKLEGLFNQSVFKANGDLNFDNNSGMDLNIDFKKTNFTDAQKMFGLIFNNVKLPVVPEFNFSANYKIKGGFDLESLKVDGSIKGTDLKIFGEEAERININFNLQNSMLAFKEVKINKSRGEINASANINLSNNYSELDGSVQNLRLRDFNFYKKLDTDYDGEFSADFYGNGTADNFSSRFKTKLSNTFIENIPASPSSAVIYLNPNDLVVNASLLAGKIKLDSSMNFKTRLFSVKSTIETNDIRELLGIVAAHNMSEKNITGKIKAQVNSVFNADTLAVRKFALDINQFNLKKGDVNLLVDQHHNSVSVDEGIVKNWDLRFNDGNDFFTSKGHNSLNNVVVYDQSFSIKTSLLEFVTNTVDKAVGVMKGSFQLVADKSVSISKLDLHGDKNSIKLKNLPGSITELEYGVFKNGKNFVIQNLKGKYGEGDFKIGGTISPREGYPELNLDYKIEKSSISLFKRSNILLSSAGTISGTNLPYRLNGKVSLLHGELLDDPADFTVSNKINLDEFKKYLPEKSEALKRGYVELNITFDTLNPILLKNNLAEVYLKSSGTLLGDLLNPEINTRIEVTPNLSKFKFKGHDFILSQGYVEIRDRSKTRTSDMKFLGIAKVNDYDVKLDISGSIEKTNIALSSEPALSPEDLLSLLTLGVTNDMSKNLEARDRTSVTTVGIGTLLVDQLKINEDLNSSLGLNLSVLPEFKEDESSLVGGKSAVTDGSTSKLKTATKIKIKKQINKVVDVSVSSTVGGSIEQTQEMNVNYNINKKFSLEGVYEIKPAEDGNTNTNTTNSIGADLKYKWSF